MQVVQKISKSTSVKTFENLADVFCQDIEKLMGLFCVVVITFDIYYLLGILSLESQTSFSCN